MCLILGEFMRLFLLLLLLELALLFSFYSSQGGVEKTIRCNTAKPIALFFS